MEYAIKRDFAHKVHGEIGGVRLDASIDSVAINGTKLPAKSVEYLLNFALQSLQDAYAGAKNEDEAKASFEKKLASLVDGTIGVRTGGGGQSEETRVAISVTRAILKANLTAEAFAQYKEDDDAVLAAFEKNRDKVQPHVDARLAELRKERERKAKLAKGFELAL